MSAARVLLGVLFSVGLLGTLFNGADIFSRLLLLSALIAFTSWAMSYFGAQGLGLQRRTRALKARVGGVFEEHFEISNRGRFATFWLEVFNESNLPGAAGSRVLTRIASGQTRSYASRIWLTRRGRFNLGPTALTTSDYFGLFQTVRKFPAQESITVLPAIYEVTSFPYLPGLLSGGQVIRRKSMDVTPHASGVREYVAGDPLKRIHWPSTARRGRMMVKEFEQDPQSEMWILLDVQSRVHAERKQEVAPLAPETWLFGRRPKFKLPPSSVEYAMSISASLAHYFARQNRAVGLVAAGRAYTVIQAERSERQESKILETLAFLSADGRMSIAALAAAQARQLPSGSGVVLITPTVHNDILAAIDDLLRRNLRPVVILLMTQSFGGAPGSEDVAHALSERGVPVCPIYCDADISRALSSFSVTPISITPAWQTSTHST